MTPERDGDPDEMAGRLEFQSRLLDLLRHDLDAAREASEWKDRANQETWRRARLFEMLLEQSQREWGQALEEQKRSHEEQKRFHEEERARLHGELLRLRSTLSWRITAPLRRLAPLRQPSAAPSTAGPVRDSNATPAPSSAPAAPTARVQPKPWRQLDLMEDAVSHLEKKGFRPRVVLDIGAAHGHWSQRAAARFPEATFYLFDPLEENALALRTLSDRDPRFHHFLTALGRARGTLTMNIAPELHASSLLQFPGQERIATPRLVPVESLDALLASGRVPQPDLVKIDVQGFELEVLAGATGLFGSGCVFVVEVNLFEFMPGCPVAHEVMAYFAERGYRLFDVAGLLRRPFQNDLGQMDLVFAPRDSPLVASAQWA